MKNKNLRTLEELKLIAPLMRQLRSHLDESEIIARIIEAQKSDGNKLLGFFENSICKTLMGYRFLTDLVHRCHMYIDDLVVCENFRGLGLGRRALEKAESIAKENNCQRVRLCTEIHHEDGKAFYQKVGWGFRV